MKQEGRKLNCSDDEYERLKEVRQHYFTIVARIERLRDDEVRYTKETFNEDELSLTLVAIREEIKSAEKDLRSWNDIMKFLETKCFGEIR